MSVYLFTYHAYRSWNPDHPRGYTRRGIGYVKPDAQVARQYAAQSTGAPTVFDIAVQRRLIEHVRTIPSHIEIRVHAVTTEPSHLHVLVSWTAELGWMRVRSSIKTSVSMLLTRETKSLRLSRGASRKWVTTRKHFDHLMRCYLPRHSGVQWYEDRGWVSAKREAREKRRDA